MPKSWSKKKRNELNGKPHTQRPDLDNLIKAFKDALCEDDSHVHTYYNMRKIWGEDGKIIITS
jgi:Holliday junction resolvase RusA-like endonuclease